MNYSQYASEYKARLTADGYRLVERFVDTLDVIENKGRRAAQDGKQPPCLDDFIEWVYQDEDLEVAELLFEVYMDGYNAGRTEV